jgi:ADP-ribosylglycohydrolase
MAISIVETLADCQGIDASRLAQCFGARYRQDPSRGYGGTAHGILTRICAGEPWYRVAPSAFGGMGSMGNGGAMRAAPIGAYFGDDMERAARAASASAAVTHSHDEGRAGAVAVAVAAAWATSGGAIASEMFEAVLAHTPDGATRAGVAQAAGLCADYDVRTAANVLGNGSGLIAEDTVPFTLWCAARHLDSFEDALWTTVSGLGDRDTTCAIVGGILGARPRTVIPGVWRAAREPLNAFWW